MEAVPENKKRKKPDPREFEAINNAVKKILTSKLLLDEDQEVVLIYWKLILARGKDYDADYRVLYGMLAGLGFLTNVHNRNLVIAGLCSIPITFAAAKGVYEQYRGKYYNRMVDEMTSVLGEVFCFMKTVIIHLRKREDYLTSLRTTASEDMYTLMMAAEETFTSQVYRAFKAAAIAAQNATKENCLNLEVSTQAYREICDVDLNKFVANLSHGDFAAAVDTVRREFCLMMSSFLGSLVVKFSTEIEDNPTFYDIMGTTVKDLIFKLTVTLKQKVTFEKLKQLHKVLETDIERPVVDFVDARSKKIDDLLLYFQTGYDLVVSLNKCNTSDVHTSLNNHIKCVIDHLKLSGVQIDTLRSMFVKEVVNAAVAEPAAEVQVFSDSEAGPSVELIRCDDPEEEREDEEYECMMLDDSDQTDNASQGGYYDDPLGKPQKDVVITRNVVMAELNNRLLLIRQQRELKKGIPLSPNCDSMSSDNERDASSSPKCPEMTTTAVIHPVPPSFLNEDEPSTAAGVPPVPPPLPELPAVNLGNEAGNQTCLLN